MGTALVLALLCLCGQGSLAQNVFSAQCGLANNGCVFQLSAPLQELVAANLSGVQSLYNSTESLYESTNQRYNSLNNNISVDIAEAQANITSLHQLVDTTSNNLSFLNTEITSGLNLATALGAQAETLAEQLACITNPGACRLIPDLTRRVDCHPDPDTTSTFPDGRVGRAACVARGCVYDGTLDLGIPGFFRCYYPPGTGYAVNKVGASGSNTYQLKKTGVPCPFGADMNLNVSQNLQSNATMHIQITDSDNARFSPGDIVTLPDQTYPYVCAVDHPGRDVPNDEKKLCDHLDFHVLNNSATFGFSVTRRSNGRVLFDAAAIQGLMFTKQFIQLPFYTASRQVYGFGENTHQRLMHNMSRYKTWPMFARDEGPNSKFEDVKNLYGVHPFYICVEADGKAHGVLIFNSNAQEVALGPGPGTRGYINYRTIGGRLDLYLFPGPSPEQVIQQYQSLIGRPMLPAYWGLGFQLSRWGYGTIANVAKVINRNFKARVPQETQVFDIDYMSYKMDFTYDKVNWPNITSFVKNHIHANDMHLITILDPAIDVSYKPFLDGLKHNIYVTWPNISYVENCQSTTDPFFVCPLNNNYNSTKGTNVMLGTVWPNHNVAFPDWIGNPSEAMRWWYLEILTFYKDVPFDGLWIDMNEPANFATNDPHAWYFFDKLQHHSNISMLFCPHNEYDFPPYDTLAAWNYNYNGWDNRLYNKTLCMDAQQGPYKHYDVHSLYGWSESQPTQQALHRITGKRGAVISRSTFVSSGRFTGHWLGDNTAGWDDLRTSVIGCVEFNWFGISYIGADVCGFNDDSNAELCLRWQQAGAMYTFYRNHNGIGHLAQDPAAWNGTNVARATSQAINFRYYYLPYLYTLMYEATSAGTPVLRAFFFDFNDTTSRSVDQQLTWGGGLVWTPVLQPGVHSVRGYFPPSANFYSLTHNDYGQPVQRDSTGHATLPAPNTTMIPVHAKEGLIYPRQASAMRLATARQNNMELLVVPSQTYNGQAKGRLFWDNGEDIVLNTTSGGENFYYFRFNYIQSPAKSRLSMKQFTSAAANGVKINPLGRIEIFNYGGPANCSSLTWTAGNATIPVTNATCNYSASQKILVISAPSIINLSQVPVGAAGNADSGMLQWSFSAAASPSSAGDDFNPNALQVLEESHKGEMNEEDLIDESLFAPAAAQADVQD